MSGQPIRRLKGNPEYQAIIDGRQGVLRKQIEAFLPAGSTFVWELGSGHGHFLTAYAQAHPERRCVGIDIATERVARALRKRDRAKLENLAFLQAEARLFVDTLPAGVRFSAVFVLFPDPWPKLRHHKHRIMQADFLQAAAQRATPDCRLFFRTDFEPYFQDTQAVIHAHPNWEPVSEPWPFEFETVFQQRAPAHHSLVARLRP